MRTLTSSAVFASSLLENRTRSGRPSNPWVLYVPISRLPKARVRNARASMCAACACRSVSSRAARSVASLNVSWTMSTTSELIVRATSTSMSVNPALRRIGGLGPVEQGGELDAGAVADGHPIERGPRALHLHDIGAHGARAEPTVEVLPREQAVGGHQAVLIGHDPLVGVHALLGSRQLAEEPDRRGCGEREDRQRCEDFEQDHATFGAHQNPA